MKSNIQAYSEWLDGKEHKSLWHKVLAQVKWTIVQLSSFFSKA